MKKFLLVLVVLIGVCFSANAQKQSRFINLPKGGNIEVTAHLSNVRQIVCRGYCNSTIMPVSGTIYITISYVDKNGNNASDRIKMYFDSIGADGWGNKNALKYDYQPVWYGKDCDIRKITDFKIENGGISYQ